MKKKTVLASLAGYVSVALAQTAESPVSFFAGTDLAVALAMAATAIGCAIAQGLAISRAVEGIARQPEAAGRIQGVLLIGLGFIESLAIYVLVIALILIFANPATTILTH
jgi:F-type H+-transporting ATPase subunit c